LWLYRGSRRVARRRRNLLLYEGIAIVGLASIIQPADPAVKPTGPRVKGGKGLGVAGRLQTLGTGARAATSDRGLA
jgi:hypothetical protein